MLLVLLSLLCLFSGRDASYCDELETPVPPCSNPVPRDLLFIVDGSESMQYDRFYAEMIDYTQNLYCAFDPSQQNQAGMILFNKDIRTLIPLRAWNQDEWYEQTELVRDSKGTANEPCCSCCTPTAEAFQLALEIFKVDAISDYKIAFVITDGVPSNNDAGLGGNPNWWYYGSSKGYNPARYNAQIVGQEAAKLKEIARVLLVGVPNRDNLPPDVEYFSGTGKYAFPPVEYSVFRSGKKWTYNYNKPPNPIVTQPTDKNSYSSPTWNVSELTDQTVGGLCETTTVPTKSPTGYPTRPPSRRPTPLPSKTPTLLPTRIPTTLMPSMSPSLAPTGNASFNQVDLTFVIDSSTSMLWQNDFCSTVLSGLPDVFPNSGTPSSSACWELFLRYVLLQSLKVAQIDNAGPGRDRILGWASNYSMDGYGLRVQVIGFACSNKQKTPLVFSFSDEYTGGKPITRPETLVAMLGMLRTTFLPSGGTCPGASLEENIKFVERSPFEMYPFQTTILLTDGVFYDMPHPERATMGLQAYRVLRFAVGIAVAKEGETYGLTPSEIQLQKLQLSSFVGNKPANFIDLGTQGWSFLLQDVSQQISDQMEQFNKDFQTDPPIDRYTWCGWRRVPNCQSNDWRMQNCKWKPKWRKEWYCSPKGGVKG